MVLRDYLRANQITFKLFQDKYGNEDIFAVTHPVLNATFAKLYLFFDPTHLFKNIRNNWVTEK